MSPIFRQPVNKAKVICRAAALVALPVLIASCTPEMYRRDADREVSRILKERKDVTLGYQPQSAVSGAPAPQVKKRDYKKIPQTQLPPKMPAIESVAPSNSRR